MTIARSTSAAFALLIALLASGAPQTVSPASPAPATPAVLSPAAARVQADVAFLASDELKGRRAGTPEADRAADVARRSGSGRSAFCPPARTARGCSPSTSSTASTSARRTASRRARPRRRRRGPSGPTSARSRSRPRGAAEGEVVFAGYGIVSKDLGYDDYAGLDVKDKVVLVLRYSPDGDDEKSPFSPFAALRFKAAVAREKGAKALLVAAGPLTKDVPDDLIALRTDAAFSDAGIVALSVRRPVAEALLARLRKDARGRAEGDRRREEAGVLRGGGLARRAERRRDAAPREDGERDRPPEGRRPGEERRDRDRRRALRPPRPRRHDVARRGERPADPPRRRRQRLRRRRAPRDGAGPRREARDAPALRPLHRVRGGGARHARLAPLHEEPDRPVGIGRRDVQHGHGRAPARRQARRAGRRDVSGVEGPRRVVERRARSSSSRSSTAASARRTTRRSTRRRSRSSSSSRARTPTTTSRRTRPTGSTPRGSSASSGFSSPSSSRSRPPRRSGSRSAR